jgi:hypothetical protein
MLLILATRGCKCRSCEKLREQVRGTDLHGMEAGVGGPISVDIPRQPQSVPRDDLDELE